MPKNEIAPRIAAASRDCLRLAPPAPGRQAPLLSHKSGRRKRHCGSPMIKQTAIAKTYVTLLGGDFTARQNGRPQRD